MQWHWHGQVGIGDQFSADACQSMAKSRCAIGAVAMLEHHHQTAAPIVIVQHRQRPFIPGMFANACPVNRIPIRVERVGHVANGALRCGYELGVDPAFQTQAAGSRDQGIASQALGRQHGVDHPAQGIVAPWRSTPGGGKGWLQTMYQYRRISAA